MSWKSIVIAGLLCVLAAPVFALEANPVTAKLLGLDTAGNWVWQINVDPDQTTFLNPVEVAPAPDRGNGGSVALELGISTPAGGRGVVSAAKNATNFPSDNKGSALAAWGANVDGAGTNPDEGVAFNSTTDRVVAYLGSEFFGTLNGFAATQNGPLEALRIHAERPISSSLTTTLDFSGGYTAGASNAAPTPGGQPGGALPLFAEANIQYGITIASASKSVRVGNTNLDGIVNVVDAGKLSTNFLQPGPWRWQDGDFNGDGIINVVDGGGLATNFGLADANWTTPGVTNLALSPGAGGGSAGIATPEPTTLVLLGLSGLVAAIVRRRR